MRENALYRAAIAVHDAPFSKNNMNKTRKSISKRFKVSATGKVTYRAAGKRHSLRTKSVKQRRRMSQDHKASAGVARFVRIGAPSLFK